MSVHIVADSHAKLSDLHSMLAQQYQTTSGLLCDVSTPPGETYAVVVNVDLRAVDNISALKVLSSKIQRIPKRIFLIDERTRLATVQAYALGASHALINPVRPAQLLARLADVTAPSIAPDAPWGGREAASASAACIASMFSAARNGAAIDVVQAKAAGGKIADSIGEDGLSNWLDMVRRHHEGTYQHCLLVTGIAVDFGLSLGVGQIDLERLYSAAMFHDIGKAKIPLAVLDKPGKLDERERAMVETHPAIGHDVLRGIPGISPEILQAVRHHHEYLDGSGYPDGLSAASIPDIVRILTISDIFAALIETRTYKPTMSREAAYEVLLGMQGKLEWALVQAFRDVALPR
jgi:putative nucleotidyltransferase with HDIG domain